MSQPRLVRMTATALCAIAVGAGCQGMDSVDHQDVMPPGPGDVGSAGTGASATAGASGTDGAGGRAGSAEPDGGRGLAGSGGSGGATGGGRGGAVGTTGTSSTPDAGSNSDAARAPTFTDIYTSILVPYCSGSSCHNPGSAKGIGFASRASAYSAVRARVKPGNGAGSSFFRTVDSGSMPRGAPKLSPENLAKIKTWIDAGALDS